MRIAWLSPLSRFSDISHHSHSILRAGADTIGKTSDLTVDLFIEPSSHYLVPPVPATILQPWHDADFFAANYDLTIFNIGNNVTNHSAINRLCLSHSGIVIVHDIMMQHYWANVIFEQNANPALYAGMLLDYYGEEGAQVLEKSRITIAPGRARYAPWDTPACIDFPLIEPFLSNATQVVVHSAFAERELSKLGKFDFIRLFLPTDKKPVPEQPAPPVEEIRISSFGDISPPKNYDLLIPAIASVARELNRPIRYRIAGRPGHTTYYDRILRLAEQASHETFTCTVAPNVSETELRALKASSHMFVNIRHPNTETASGSLAEQVAVGVPVVVFASGCYDDLPDTVVQKVHTLSSTAIASSIADALEPARFTELSDGARAYAADHTAQRYFETLIASCKPARPRADDAGAARYRATLDGVVRKKARRMSGIDIMRTPEPAKQIQALSLECMALMPGSRRPDVEEILTAFSKLVPPSAIEQTLLLIRHFLEKRPANGTIDLASIPPIVRRSIVFLDNDDMLQDYYERVGQTLIGRQARDYENLVGALMAHERERFSGERDKGQSLGAELSGLSDKIGQVRDAMQTHLFLRGVHNLRLDEIDQSHPILDTLLLLGCHAPENTLVWTRMPSAVIGIRRPNETATLSFSIEAKRGVAKVSAMSQGVRVQMTSKTDVEITVDPATPQGSRVAFVELKGGQPFFTPTGSQEHPHGRMLCLKLSDFAIA
ncbi:glycosyltransferase [Ponticoccus sp. SC2-23]|uniref:glycosyltransferase n=1 Tax=Alexandriicola marinus TaxID=2081710 RepID=UPI000FDC5D83|nr:glycosyltransferase [Alexandriicola marinus]MBM1222457.1 glycosyltransferase [Ponticoccus sp. SC6-9]MBM1226963.1 glycosyltransferase [Ponticoccus sp. SC6-15]MBM1231384.1 glycosyltransferase [Ponticoccus sp. SC6-38]MBM1235957.1 glycosyltransferase [Ponticoccus sp. SC6-45]MBM1240407.1 glycosyltransferase [Ponticoccus sp. SC6-49]MBM1244942.1 glycosyltransferase [Ponticoccus sp. SC2-64]MBM1249431.1 glycosyltransferase [Ponticoccus sp. SC6-42]MBM1253900.1 glycosyltransferase [Ponticoccus sp. 